MDTPNFTASFVVEQSPAEVFDAVNNVRGWWSETIEGATDRVGASFKYRHRDLHHSTQKITELAPGRKVVWHVTESRINFVKDKAEWKGTDIVFEIARKGAGTELRLTHVGLVPGLECFSDCSGGWGYYFNGSLRRLITSGKGQPDPKEAP
jgi:hypothetical protein